MPLLSTEPFTHSKQTKTGNLHLQLTDSPSLGCDHQWSNPLHAFTRSRRFSANTCFKASIRTLSAELRSFVVPNMSARPPRTSSPTSSAQELCESRGGRPGFPVSDSRGLCGRKATLEEEEEWCHSELRSCVKVEVAALGSPSLIVLTVSGRRDAQCYCTLYGGLQ